MVTRILSRRLCENCASTSVGVPLLNQGCGLARGERILNVGDLRASPDFFLEVWPLACAAEGFLF